MGEVGYDLAAEPPRRRRWPAVVAVLLVLAVLGAVVAAAVTGRFLPYQADREELTGTPYVIRAQAGVPAVEEDRVRAGLVAVHAHLEDLGGDVDRPVEFRLTWSQGCRPTLGPTSVAAGWSQGDLVCLNASHPRWRDEVDRHAWYPSYVAAREQVHRWMADTGCDDDALDPAWRWLADGIAEHLAFEALDDAGVVAAGQVRTWLAEEGAAESGADLASDVAADTPTAQARDRYHLAASRLARDHGGSRALAEVCTAVGGGRTWDEAVASVLGLEHDGPSMDALSRQVAADAPGGAG